jgi:2-dehydro-3-deoxy-L-rhamnonate dehydrogenase (NAD+)
MNATVLITGAASGIGLAVARRVVARGARAILWDISEAALAGACRELGPLAQGTAVNIADAGAVAAQAPELATLAPTHLVNNAGVLGTSMTWDDYDADEIGRVLSVNVTGSMNVTSVFLKSRAPHPQAGIVNMASIAGENGGAPGFAAYGASKGAILALTRSMARDLAPDIRVNALAPGIIDTPIQDAVMKAPEARTAAAAGIPLGRLGTSDEVAEAAEWMLFGAGYVTGEVLRIAGGRR